MTIVPLQQLFVLNSEFMTEQARGLVKQLAGEKDDAAKVRKAFLRLYGRPATEGEVKMALDFLAGAGGDRAEAQTEPLGTIRPGVAGDE